MVKLERDSLARFGFGSCRSAMQVAHQTFASLFFPITSRNETVENKPIRPVVGVPSGTVGG